MVSGRRVGRKLAVAGVLVLLGIASAMLAARSALEPAALRAAAETRLSAMLGQPVTIGSIRIDLLPPVSAVGTNIRVGAQQGEAPALDLQRVRIVPRLRSLIASVVVIDEVRLEGLVVSVLRDRAGRWQMPAAVPVPSADASGGIVIERVRLDSSRILIFDQDAAGGLREAASIDDIEADAVAEAGGLRLPGLAGRIGRARVNGDASLDRATARMDLRLDDVNDPDLPALLALAGTIRPEFLHLTSRASASLSVRVDRAQARLTGSGSVKAPGVTVDPLKLSGFEAPYTLQGSRLTFAPATVALYGGSQRGTFTLDFTQTPARWSLDSRVDDLDLGDFLTALTEREAQIDGTAAANATLAGRVGEPLDRTVQGRTTLDVHQGVIKRFPLLAAVNRVLRLSEGEAGDTRFERLTATLALGAGRATTDDLVLHAGHMRVECAGTIGFDRSLNLDGQAVISPERSAAAIRSVHELAALRNGEGELELPLTIGGRMDNPSINIDIKRALGKSLRNELERRLRGLIRRK